jgi:AbrB family looped-hinge helix DNA binding protein
MGSATITSKGRITIPVAVRERLGLEAGDRIAFVIRDDDSAMMIPANVRLADLEGILAPPEKAASVEEMNRAIRRRGRRPRRAWDVYS